MGRFAPEMVGKTFGFVPAEQSVVARLLLWLLPVVQVVQEQVVRVAVQQQVQEPVQEIRLES